MVIEATSSTPQRIARVRQVVERWKARLVDVSGRNRLLNYRDLRAGTLDLTPTEDGGPSRRIIERLLSGSTVHLIDLFDEADQQLCWLSRKMGNFCGTTTP